MFDLFTGSRREVEVIGFLTVPLPDRRRISKAVSRPASALRDQTSSYSYPNMPVSGLPWAGPRHDVPSAGESAHGGPPGKTTGKTNRHSHVTHTIWAAANATSREIR